MNPTPCQDLYISPQVYDLLVGLAPVRAIHGQTSTADELTWRQIVETGRELSTQYVNLLLNTAFTFIMDVLPVFHQPTFSFDIIRRELCVTIFCFGLLTTGDRDLHQVGCTLLGQARSDLLQVSYRFRTWRYQTNPVSSMLITTLYTSLK